MERNIARMSRELEDRFFFEQNKALQEQYARLKREKESTEALAKVSGITNQAVLMELVEHNIRPETLAALSLVPLIEVAWADGSVDKKEEAALLAAVTEHGLGDDLSIVREWLHTKPDTKFFDVWKTYMRGLAQELSGTSLRELEIDMLKHAREVAEASGKILGLFSAISNSEKAMLENIELFFKQIGK